MPSKTVIKKAASVQTSAPETTTGPIKPKVDQQVLFGQYGEGTAKKDQVFKTGDVLTIKEVADEVTGEVLAEREDGTQAYIFTTELSGYAGEPPVKTKGKGKSGVTVKQQDGVTVVTEDGVEAKGGKGGKGKTATAKETEAEKPEVTLKHAPSVAKLLEGGAKVALKNAKELAEAITGRFYELGGVLFAIRQDNFHETVKGEDGELLKGQPGFATYVSSVLGVEYRMAQHYMNVYAITRAAGLPESKVKALKFTKVLRLLPLIEGGAISLENWDEWGTKAKELKGEAFDSAVKEAMVNANISRGASRGATSNQVRFTFVLFDDRAKVLNAALALAEKDMPPVEDGQEPHSNSAKLDHIVAEWMQFKKDQAKAAKEAAKAAKGK